MEVQRRRFLQLAASAAALPAVSRIAAAQAYPTRPVRLLLGFAPGGPNDIIARLIGERLSAIWGKPVVIDNVTGASGNLAADRVAKSAPNRQTASRPAHAFGAWSARGCHARPDRDRRTGYSRNRRRVRPGTPPTATAAYTVSNLCNVAKDWVGLCVITIKRLRELVAAGPLQATPMPRLMHC
jgi:hypothetical protein